MRPTARGAPSTMHLSVIRLAMLAGVLMFGAVVWFLVREGGPRATDPGVLNTVRLFAMVWFAAAVLGLALLVALVSRSVAEARRRTLGIVAWALGEGAALAGGVIYLFAGDARWYVAGLFILLAAFVLFPARRRD